LAAALAFLRRASQDWFARIARGSSSADGSSLPPSLRRLRVLVLVAVVISSLALIALLVLAVYVVGLSKRAMRENRVAPSALPEPAPAPPPIASTSGTPTNPTGSPETPASGASAVQTKRLAGGAAISSLNGISARLGTCSRAGGLSGRGAVWVTFARDGSVSHIKVGPPFADTPQGACIVDLYKSARVPPFLGPPGAVIYKFTLPAQDGHPDAGTGRP
jgi:hypothetical protein